MKRATPSTAKDDIDISPIDRGKKKKGADDSIPGPTLSIPHSPLHGENEHQMREPFAHAEPQSCSLQSPTVRTVGMTPSSNRRKQNLRAVQSGVTPSMQGLTTRIKHDLTPKILRLDSDEDEVPLVRPTVSMRLEKERMLSEMTSMREELASTKGHNENLKKVVRNNQATIGNLKVERDALSMQVSRLEAQNKSLQKRVEQLEEEKKTTVDTVARLKVREMKVTRSEQELQKMQELNRMTVGRLTTGLEEEKVKLSEKCNQLKRTQMDLKNVKAQKARLTSKDDDDEKKKDEGKLPLQSLFSKVHYDAQSRRLKALDNNLRELIGTVSDKEMERTETSNLLIAYASKHRIPLGSAFQLSILEDLELSLLGHFTLSQRQRIKSFFYQRGLNIFGPTNKVNAAREDVKRIYVYEMSEKSITLKNGETVTGLCQELTNIRDVLEFRLFNLVRSGQLAHLKDGGRLRICVCGDKGSNETKLALIIGDVMVVNDVPNLLMVGRYRGDDNGEMVRLMLPDVVTQLNDLTTVDLVIEGVSVKIHLDKYATGDYNFLYGLLGMSTATSSYNCPLCWRVSTHRLKDNEPVAQARTVQKMNEMAEAGKMSMVFKPLFPDIPMSNYIPGPVHTVCGAAIKFGIMPLRLCAINADLKALKYRILNHNEVQNDDDDGIVEIKLDKTRGRVTTDKKKQTAKAAEKMKEDLRDAKRAVATLKNEKKMGKALLTVLEFIQAGQIDPKKDLDDDQVCAWKHECIVRDKRSDSLPDSILKWNKCETCKNWYHSACESLFREADISQLTGDGYLCRSCGSNARSTIGSVISDVKESLSAIDPDMIEAESAARDLSGKVQKLELIAKEMGDASVALDTAFKENKAHLGTFGQCMTGNHIRACLKEGVPEKLWAAVPNDNTFDAAPHIRMMNSLRVIQKHAKASVLTDAQITSVLQALKDLENDAMLAMPDVLRSPKVHCLFVHFPELLAIHKSYAFFNDQPSEKIHQFFNKKEEQYGCITDPFRRWKSEAHDLAVANYVQDSRVS